ncbi:MAG: hypothetical protein J6S21_03070, partial [Victivallales bacterium]|nr:hypothetical protein [Victivallales bacterium]
MTEEVKGQPEKRRSLPRRLFVWLGWSVLIVLLLALWAEAALWKLGWPEFLRQLLCARIVPAHLGTCSIQTVRGALFTDIVLEGIDVNIRQGNNLAEIRAAEAVIVPRWKQLLDGKADFEEVRISGGSAHLAEYRNGKILQEREFFLEEINISAANSLGNTLTGEVSCTIQGVALRSEINLENALPWLTPKADKPERTPEASSPNASREAKPFPFEKLLDFNERLKDLAMKREWTTISLSCNGDLAEPASISIDGAFSTDGGAYRDFPIPPATGDFSYSNQILSLIGVRLMLSEKECVTVNGEMNFASGTVSAQAGGDIFPASVLRFTGTDFKL